MSKEDWNNLVELIKEDNKKKHYCEKCGREIFPHTCVNDNGVFKCQQCGYD